MSNPNESKASKANEQANESKASDTSALTLARNPSKAALTFSAETVDRMGALDGEFLAALIPLDMALDAYRAKGDARNVERIAIQIAKHHKAQSQAYGKVYAEMATRVGLLPRKGDR